MSLVATGASGSDRASYKVLVGEDPGDETAVSALGGGGGGAAPWIEIHPSVGTFGSANVPVSVHWCGNGGTLDASSRSIRLGATDVTGSFTYTTDPECGARSEGTVTLASGVNTLYADICNTNGLCGSGSAEYTYSAGSAPVVSLAPHAGSRINRPRCVISSAGPGAAFQCGELIAMHAMPTFTSRTARGIFSCFTTAPRPACSRW